MTLELAKHSHRDTVAARDTGTIDLARDRDSPRQPHDALHRAASFLHDMRSPLAAICGSAELLLAGNLDQTQTRRLAASLHAAATRMKDMLSEHAVASASGETIEICNLRAIVVNSCESAGLMERRDIALSLDVPVPLQVPAARLKMQSVIRNLVVNAVEAMPLGGSLRIVAREQQDRAWIEIEDTGPGVPAEIRDSLFEPLATAGKKDGLGLGLALARQAVEDHGGELWTEPAAGARFVISLPLGPQSGASRT